jgi:hypothetical protein
MCAVVVALQVLEFIAGLLIVVAVIDAAVRTFVLPRPSGVTLTRWVALAVRAVFDLFAGMAKSYEGQDRVMALYGPVTLLTFSIAWLGGTGVGFALMFHAVSDMGWRQAIRISGSALLTLGFVVPNGGALVAMDFIEAAIGLILIALLIAYLPTIYSAFSRREVLVSQLTVRAGVPPTPAELFVRAHRVGYLDRLDDLFVQWQLWFVEMEETHTSLSILTFFRSTNPHRSWLTSAGCILDAAALKASTLDLPTTPEPQLCVRSGYLALRALGRFFQIPFDPDPSPSDPISITREEFDAVYDQLVAEGVPVRTDRDRCWADYAGWRVNYDSVLIALAGLIAAPYAPWISDRSLARRRHRAPLLPNRRSRQAG